MKAKELIVKLQELGEDLEVRIDCEVSGSQDNQIQGVMEGDDSDGTFIILTIDG